MTHCPKCDADITDSFQKADPSVGIMSGGFYCDACDLPIEDDYDPLPDDVLPLSNPESKRPLGTPISQLSSRPGELGYEEFVRISKSWGYE